MGAADPCPVPFEESLTAFRTEGWALEVVLNEMQGPWQLRTTRLPAWNLGELVAHVLRCPTRIEEYLDVAPPRQAETDWITYWRAARDSDPSDIAKRARDMARDLRPEELVERFGSSWRGALHRAHEVGADRILPTPFGGMRLDHYLTTRVVELTVHGLDVRSALLLEEVATPQALRVTCRVLEELCGGERPDHLADDDVAFVLAATGRVEDDGGQLPVLS